MNISYLQFAQVLSPRLAACVGFCRRGRSCWERKYLRLEGNELQMFDHEPTSEMMTPSQKFLVCRSEGTTSILSSVPYSDVMNTAKSDLPFIFKVCMFAYLYLNYTLCIITRYSCHDVLCFCTPLWEYKLLYFPLHKTHFHFKYCLKFV
jgi:hypothetical protein